MNKRRIPSAWGLAKALCSVWVLSCCPLVGAQTAAYSGALPGTGVDYDVKIRQELQAAKTDAEFEFLGTLGRICLLPQSSDLDTSDTVPAYVADPSKAPARETWFAPSAKVFDNFYFVGGKIHSSWALKTSAGIILFDTLFPYNSAALIEGGFKKLGLNPKDIKYVIISHAHQDHIGGAEYLQKKIWRQSGHGRLGLETGGILSAPLSNHGAQTRDHGHRWNGPSVGA